MWIMIPGIEYSRLAYVDFGVTDPKRSLEFYHDMVGLEPVSESDDECRAAASADAHGVILSRSEIPGIRRVSWEVATPQVLDRMAESLRRWDQSIQIHVPSPDELRRLSIGGEAIRFRGPGGLVHEFMYGFGRRESYEGDSWIGVNRVLHAVLSVPRGQMDDVCNFYKGTLGFEESDFIDGVAVWMRCFPNPDHHSFAVLSIGNPKCIVFDHLAFNVSTLDGLMRGWNRLKKNGVEIVSGPGKHFPSGSEFLYFLDPDGITLEFSHGMEQIYPGGRLPRDLGSHDIKFVVDMWGGDREVRGSARPACGAILAG